MVSVVILCCISVINLSITDILYLTIAISSSTSEDNLVLTSSSNILSLYHVNCLLLADSCDILLLIISISVYSTLDVYCDVRYDLSSSIYLISVKYLSNSVLDITDFSKDNKLSFNTRILPSISRCLFF